MTTVQEAVQKRNNKAQNLRVIEVDDDHFVSSEDGLILYKVTCGNNGEGNSCTCGDFARGFKTDPQYACKHILALMNCEHDTEKARYLEKTQPKLDPRFIVQIDNQDFVKYAGLLDLAHQKKLTNLEADIVQYPTKENERTAICKAHARTALGESFIDFGDANPTNCNAKVARHLIRMASTRAKARCLRDLTNVGITCLEELGDLDEVIGNEEKGTAQRGKVKPFPKKILKAETPASQPGNGNEKRVTPADSTKNASTPQSKEATKETLNTTSQPNVKGSEKSGNNGQKKARTDTALMSEAQKRAIFNLSRRRGISVDELEKMSTDIFGVSLDKLCASHAVSLIRNLQQSA